MSITFDQIVSDAKRLVTRLKQRENDADNLLKDTQMVNRKIEDFKQYRNEVETLNNAFSERGRSANYLASLKDDNSYLDNLHKENQKLQALIEDYQDVMEHVMRKYRKHTSKNAFETKIDLKSCLNLENQETILRQSEKIGEMASVMSYAAEVDEQNALKNDELLVQLHTENKVLRDLLKISMKYGSVDVSDVPPQLTALPDTKTTPDRDLFFS